MTNPEKTTTVTLRPSDEMLAKQDEVAIVGAGTLQIGLKRPGVLREFQIVEIVGDSAKNDVYMAMIMPLLWVVSIDNDPEAPISSKRELEALISRLGSDAITAITSHVYSVKKDAAPAGDKIKN